MDPITRQAIAVAGGAGGGEGLYVDDLFSTFIYDGNGSSTQAINNGIDLSGEGGMVWIKCRSDAADHRIVDTERGANNTISPNSTGANGNYSSVVSSINSNGFTVATDATTNWSGRNYVSWSFRKAPGFFDVVTYTGDGTDNRNISHSLGSTPGMLIIKVLDVSDHWLVWHRSVSGGDILRLNDTAAAGGYSSSIPSSPSSTHFTVSSNVKANQSGRTYVAYLFAHDDQSFGANGDEAIIKCGSFVIGNGAVNDVDLGFEPQFVLTKLSNTTGSWLLSDVMRGAIETEYNYLTANSSNAESTLTGGNFYTTSTGFHHESLGAAGNTVVYMAIRRPHKQPTVGTEVFSILSRSGNSTNTSITGVGFPPDSQFTKVRSSGNGYLNVWFDKLRGAGTYIKPAATTQENTSSNIQLSFDQDGVTLGNGSNANGSGYAYINYFFKRAAGFFDVVTYTGDGTYDGSKTVNHNLGVAPEMIINKSRSTDNSWNTYHTAISNTYIIRLNMNSSRTGIGQNFNPTATTFDPLYAGNALYSSNTSGVNYISYLFATLDGISKVGSYTGTGSDINVDCGFTAGARFIVIKRTDSTGDWYFWDSVRGIVSGDDRYLRFNTTDAEVMYTDYVDPLNAGFTVTSSAPAALNASGGTYLFLAIA